MVHRLMPELDCPHFGGGGGVKHISNYQVILKLQHLYVQNCLK